MSSSNSTTSIYVDIEPSPTASDIIISGSSTPSNGECQRDRCISLELRLEASQVDNLILKDEIKKMKEGLEKVEMEIRTKDRMISDLNGMKGAVKKLYSVAETVLAAMIGSDYIEDVDYNEENHAQLIDKFCGDLQVRLLEWQESHQKLHDKLAETLKVTEELAEQLDDVGFSVVDLSGDQLLADSPGPSATSTPTTSALSRRNPVRKCRSWADKACPLHQSVSSQFGCDNCGKTYCRLSHISLKMRRLKNRNPAPKVKTEAGVTEVETKFDPPVPSEMDQESADDRVESDMKQENDQTVARPIMKVVDPSGQEHRFAGSYKTILPSEQMKIILDGTAPTKALRFFCKCGRHYPNWSALYHHVKFIGKSSHFQCGLCEEGFEIRTGMKAHLRITHGVEYCSGRFACLECGEDFATIQEVGDHQKLLHKTEEVGESVI